MLEALARRDLAILEHCLDRLWAVSHMQGSYLCGPGLLVGQFGALQRADAPERMDRYVARLSAVPGYLEAIGEVMRDAVDAGQVAPAVVVDRSIGLVERQLEAGPEISPAMQPVAEAEAEDRERIAAVLADRVLPAYDRYLEALREYRPSARETLGLHALRGGERIYAAEILGWTGLTLDPRELHDLGRAQLDGIREEGRAIASSLGFPDRAAAVAAHTGNEVARDGVLELARSHVEKGWEGSVPLRALRRELEDVGEI